MDHPLMPPSSVHPEDLYFSSFSSSSHHPEDHPIHPLRVKFDSSFHPEDVYSSSSSSSLHPDPEDVPFFSSSSSTSSLHPEDVPLYSSSSSSSFVHPEVVPLHSSSSSSSFIHPDDVLLFSSSSTSDDPSDLDSIESSLSPDALRGHELELDLDALLFCGLASGTVPCSGELIRYQFDQSSDVTSTSSSSSFSSSSSASDSSASSSSHHPDADIRFPSADQDHVQLLEAQARRNAQIAQAMSPLRKWQECLQTAQRRQGQQQKAKRKFSLKNGPTTSAGQNSAAGRQRVALNSSVRRWRAEIGHVLGQKPLGMPNRKNLLNDKISA